MRCDGRPSLRQRHRTATQPGLPSGRHPPAEHNPSGSQRPGSGSEPAVARPEAAAPAMGRISLHHRDLRGSPGELGLGSHTSQARSGQKSSSTGLRKRLAELRSTRADSALARHLWAGTLNPQQPSGRPSPSHRQTQPGVLPDPCRGHRRGVPPPDPCRCQRSAPHPRQCRRPLPGAQPRSAGLRGCLTGETGSGNRRLCDRQRRHERHGPLLLGRKPTRQQ